MPFGDDVPGYRVSINQPTRANKDPPIQRDGAGLRVELVRPNQCRGEVTDRAVSGRSVRLLLPEDAAVSPPPTSAAAPKRGCIPTAETVSCEIDCQVKITVFKQSAINHRSVHHLFFSLPPKTYFSRQPASLGQLFSQAQSTLIRRFFWSFTFLNEPQMKCTKFGEVLGIFVDAPKI